MAGFGGFQLAKAWVVLGADLGDLASGLQAGVKMVIDAFSEGTKLAGGFLTPFTLWGQGVLKQGVQAAIGFEKTMLEMETMLGSANEAEKTLARLTKFAVDTPFEMPGILNVARELTMFGERGDELMSTIKILGDASGGEAQRFAILGTVFNQIRGTGKLLTQDFRQLSTRGIISLKDIAKHYKTTDAAASQMLSSGRVKFEDFRNILKSLTETGGRFDGMMQKQSRSLGGLISTMNDAKNIAIRLLATPLVPGLKMITDMAIKVAGTMEMIVRNGKSLVSYAFTGAVAMSALATSFTIASFAAKLFGMTLRSVLIASGVGLVIVGIGAALGVLIAWMEKMRPVQKMMKEGWKLIGEAGEYLIGMFANLRAWFMTSEYMMLNVIQATKNIRGAWNRLKDTALIVFEGIKATLNSLAELFIHVFGGVVGEGGKNFEIAFSTIISTVTLAVLEISEWVQAIAMNWQAVWDQFPQIVIVAGSYLLDIISGMMVAMPKLIYTAISYIADYWWNIFTVFLPKATGYGLGLILDWIKTWGIQLVEMWTVIWTNLPNPMEIMTAMLEGGPAAVAEIFSSLAASVTEAAGTISDSFTAGLGGEIPTAADIFAPSQRTLDSMTSSAEALQEAFDPSQRTQDLAGGVDALVNVQKTKDELEKLRDVDVWGGGNIGTSAKAFGDVAGGQIAAMMVDAGRYGFMDFGNKLQDAMLKGKDGDLDKTRNSLLEQGLAKQDELIKATKGRPTGGGLAP